MSTALISFTASFILPSPDMASALKARVSTPTTTLTLHSGVSVVPPLTGVIGVVLQQHVGNLDTLGVEFVIVHALLIKLAVFSHASRRDKSELTSIS